MASSIVLSDNGVTSGSAGIKSTGGSDGTLLLQTTTSGGTATTAVTVDNAQNVGIGTTSWSTSRLYVLGNTTNYGITSEAPSGYGGFTFKQTSGNSWALGMSSNSLFFYNGTASSEAMRIDSSGNLLVGTTGTVYSGKIGVSFNGNGGAGSQGIALIDTNASLSGDYALFVNSSGNVAGRITHNGTTTVAYTTSSDYRLKENIAPMTGALAKVAALKPVTYKWKDDQSASEGFIAHELAEVCPQAVVGGKDAVDADGNPKYQGIDTSFLVATLTAAIQELAAASVEQQSLIQSLTDRLTALEGAAK